MLTGSAPQGEIRKLFVEKGFGGTLLPLLGPGKVASLWGTTGPDTNSEEALRRAPPPESSATT